MMAWALAFPSWFGTIYLLWAAFSVCLRARNLLLPSLPLLVAYGSLIMVLEYVAALPVLTIPDTVSDRGGGLEACRPFFWFTVPLISLIFSSLHRPAGETGASSLDRPAWLPQ